MIKAFFRTQNDWASLFARLSLGVAMLPHGLQKTLGMFGGHGFDATVQHFTTKMGMPAAVAILVILAESAGAIRLNRQGPSA